MFWVMTPSSRPRRSSSASASCAAFGSLVAERVKARPVVGPEAGRVALEDVDVRDLHRVDVRPEPGLRACGSRGSPTGPRPPPRSARPCTPTRRSARRAPPTAVLNCRARRSGCRRRANSSGRLGALLPLDEDEGAGREARRSTEHGLGRSGGPVTAFSLSTASTGTAGFRGRAARRIAISRDAGGSWFPSRSPPWPGTCRRAGPRSRCKQLASRGGLGVGEAAAVEFDAFEVDVVEFGVREFVAAGALASRRRRRRSTL